MTFSWIKTGEKIKGHLLFWFEKNDLQTGLISLQNGRWGPDDEVCFRRVFANHFFSNHMFLILPPDNLKPVTFQLLLHYRQGHPVMFLCAYGLEYSRRHPLIFGQGHLRVSG